MNASLKLYLAATYHKKPTPRSGGSVIGCATINGTYIEYRMAQPFGCASLVLAELNTIFLALHTIDPIYVDSTIEVIHDCQSVKKILEKTTTGDYRAKPIQNSDLVKQIRDLVAKFPDLTIRYTTELDANLNRANSLAAEAASTQIRNAGTITNDSNSERNCRKKG